jgi:DNA-binding PadR family transcriptional regulator
MGRKMRLQSNTLIAGVPARDLRAAFQISHSSGSIAGFSEWLKLPEAETQRVLDELVIDGFLSIEDDHHDAKKWYSLTVKGSAVVNAHFVKPMTRARADELVEQIVERCQSVNADGELLYYLEEIVAFGSYADPASQDFGDLDLVLTLKIRPGIKNREELTQLSQARFARSGGPSRNLLWSQSADMRLAPEPSFGNP